MPAHSLCNPCPDSSGFHIGSKCRVRPVWFCPVLVRRSKNPIGVSRVRNPLTILTQNCEQIGSKGNGFAPCQRLGLSNVALHDATIHDEGCSVPLDVRPSESGELRTCQP